MHLPIGLLVILMCLGITPSLADHVSVKSDPRFVKLKTALPDGWSLYVTADTLFIENAQPVWVWHSNFINAPLQDLEKDDTNKEKIQKNGTETKACLAFVLKNRKLLGLEELAKANYTAKYYALFELRASGFDTPFTRYYPYTVEAEASRIYNVLLGEYLKAVRGPEYAAIDYQRP